MADDDPNPTAWGKSIIAIIREPAVAILLSLLAVLFQQWIQSQERTRQHNEKIEESRKLQDETKANGEKLQKIEAKLPSRVYLGAAKE